MPRGYKRAEAAAWAIKERSFTRPIAEVEAQILLRRTVHKGSESAQVLSKATATGTLGHPRKVALTPQF